MKFKYSAFIENTPEMREWLERLGYTPLRFSLNGKYLYARSCTWANKSHTWKEPYFATGNNIEEYSDLIDCRSNPELFKAVTAIREDSDYMQWFVREESESDLILDTDNIDNWVLCEINNFQEFGDYFGVYHKATLSELQEHFDKGK